MLAQRILPEIETETDVVDAGVSFVLAFASMRSTDSEFIKMVSAVAWEQEVAGIEAYRSRMHAILDRIEALLQSSKAQGFNQEFLRAYSSLENNRSGLDDEDITSRANKLWVLYRDHAQELRKKS